MYLGYIRKTKETGTGRGKKGGRGVARIDEQPTLKFWGSDPNAWCA